MSTKLHDFLELSYSELETLNLAAKQQRRDRVPAKQIQTERLKYLADESRIKAVTPQWNQPLPKFAGFVSAWDPATHTLNDSNVTTMPKPGIPGAQLWSVNTIFTVNSPHPPNVPADQLFAPIPPTQKTIGDLLTDHRPSISWKWYSGGWDLVLKDPAKEGACTFPSVGDPHPVQVGPCFQFHHQPFAFFQRWGTDGSPEKAAHLQDEQNFLADLKHGTLPAVSFIKPLGVDNEHPVYATLVQGQRHVTELVKAVCDSKYWPNTIVIITYDENGGRWDHVTPPKVDQWGPGTRVPTIVISPYVRAHTVDHAQAETNSILTLIEKRFGLSNLGSHDATANPMLEAFDFTQTPSACNAS